MRRSPNHPTPAVLRSALDPLFDGKKDYAGAEAVALRQAVGLDKTNGDAIEKWARCRFSKATWHRLSHFTSRRPRTIPGMPPFTFFPESPKQNWDQAKAMYQQALVVSPDNPLAANNLAYAARARWTSMWLLINMAQTACCGNAEFSQCGRQGLGLLSEGDLPLCHRSIWKAASQSEKRRAGAALPSTTTLASPTRR